MSGDWHIKTKFGSISFTIDPDGKKVTDAQYVFNDWTCGDIELSATLYDQEDNSADDGVFHFDDELSDKYSHTIDVYGTYDPNKDRFTGSLEEEAPNGTKCTEDWITEPR